MPEEYSNRSIIELRPGKNRLDPYIPYHFLHEQEPDLSGNIESTNTIFLTSKECVFKCLMCDLWKNTLDEPPPPGAIVAQIDYALSRLPKADTIKLYNNGNFFDPNAIPPLEYPAIANRLRNYKRVIVENHPKLCNESCIAFSKLIDGKLEVAIGLETIHPEVLPKLNKQITTDDFRKAVAFLKSHEIDARAFVLLNPPYLIDEKENIEWAFKTVEFAFASGAIRCSIIPVRSGNGVMDVLWKNNDYVPPSPASLEKVFERALALKQGQVFVDTWEIGFLSNCDLCFDARKERLEKMNLSQKISPKIECSCTNNETGQN